ncbi:Hypothetical protein PMT_2522 [Prochlorococcus marinus str. MIT 9313]|uniref:Uncharacterized protein n=1 Tax=Prochlorococcus marinus (strain MIT 9313) TaxID=74547 RepID=B9ERU0_PROMM|nr:Hypothetical protein PMT_2522 [Prochlorococcus marinus str. MIT 9313]
MWMTQGSDGKDCKKLAGGPSEPSGEGRFNPSAPRPVVES